MVSKVHPLKDLRVQLSGLSAGRNALTREEERTLLHAARGGDSRALRRIVREVSGPAYRFGRTFCRHHDDAEDVMQDVLATVVRRLDSFRGESSLSSWAWVVARNACARMRRKRKGEPAVMESLDADSSFGGAFTLAAPGADPSHAAEAMEIREALRVAMADLPKPQREAVLLRDVEGLPADRAAKLLKINLRALKSRLHRGRAALRIALRPFLETGGEDPETGCPDIPGAASRFLEGEISASVCSQFEAHIAACPKCRKTCRSFQKMMKLCRSFGTASPRVSRDMVKTAEGTLRRA